MTTRSVEVRWAASAEEQEAVYRLRYEVMTLDGYHAPCESERLTDAFDSGIGSRLLVAWVGQVLAGSLRWTKQVDGKSPAAAFCDFTPFLDAGAACGSQFVVRREYRLGHAVSIPLLESFHDLCRAERCPQAFGVMNPRIAGFLKRHGYQEVGPVDIHSGTGLPFVPMVRCFKTPPKVVAASTR